MLDRLAAFDDVLRDAWRAEHPDGDPPESALVEPTFRDAMQDLWVVDSDGHVCGVRTNLSAYDRDRVALNCRNVDSWLDGDRVPPSTFRRAVDSHDEILGRLNVELPRRARPSRPR